MNQLELAIYSTVHDFDGKTEDLALLLGMGVQILRNKANYNNEDSFFSPMQLVMLQNVTGNYSINAAFHALNKSKPSLGKSITRSLLSVADEVGSIAREFNRAADDHLFTAREKADCIKQATKVLNAAKDLVASFEEQEVGAIRAA